MEETSAEEIRETDMDGEMAISMTQGGKNRAHDMRPPKIQVIQRKFPTHLSWSAFAKPKLIGQGAYGKVFRVYHKGSEDSKYSMYAVK